MSYRNLGLGLALLFITFTSFSQAKQYQYYLDKNFNSIEPAKSIFSGIGIYKNGLVEVRFYNAANKTLAFIEHFTDSSLQLSNGLYQSFYTDSSRELEGSYLNGKEVGVWKKWDSLGHMIDSSIYNNGEKNLDVEFGYYNNGILGSYIVNNIKMNQLHDLFYDESANVVREINFTGENGVEKVYKNGSIISSDSLFTRAETEAYFPGGDHAWTQYIMVQIQNHSDELSSDDYGTCWVKFIVGIDGKVTNVEATTMQHTHLAEIIIHAIQYGPKWKPAMQFGRPVKAYRKEPVTISNPN